MAHGELDQTEWEGNTTVTTPCDTNEYQNARFDAYYNWPYPAMEVEGKTALINDKVRSAGAPNYRGARIPLPSPLRPASWKAESTGHVHDATLINGIEFGFPIQYTGGPCYEPDSNTNHPSADAYTAHVQEYFGKETSNEAMAGPFTSPPFTPWCKISPMMTRPKAEEGKRRVIVDLSFPHGGVNAYVHPHLYNGQEALHTLPTITDLLQMVREADDADTQLAVIDIRLPPITSRLRTYWPAWDWRSQ